MSYKSILFIGLVLICKGLFGLREPSYELSKSPLKETCPDECIFNEEICRAPDPPLGDNDYAVNGTHSAVGDGDCLPVGWAKPECRMTQEECLLKCGAEICATEKNMEEYKRTAYKGERNIARIVAYRKLNNASLKLWDFHKIFQKEWDKTHN